MSLKCPVESCERTFGKRSSYSQHVRLCIKKLEFEDLKKPEFPNEAYKDLMLLVTDHKLNNKAGNAVIRFFNKHSTLLKSPLLKNIKNGREFMNKMNYPNLTFNKICITYYNRKEYFLHYQNLIHCIKNIL